MGNLWRCAICFGALCLGPLALATMAPDESLAGVIQYQGGFTDQATLVIPSKDLVKYFRVEIPSFCKDVEVDQAFTITEGVKDQAQPSIGQPLIFSVNHGAGQRVSAIVLTLNGPNNSACTLPVYLRAQGPEQPPVAGRLRLCNRTFKTIWAAVGYPAAHGTTAEGWYEIGRHDCVMPKTTQAITGVFYTHAENRDGRVWGNGSQLCVHATDNFKATGLNCQHSDPGFEMAPFSQYNLAGTSQFTVDFTR